MSERTIPDFESDVFISYAHIDDEPTGAERRQFVSELHAHIEKRGHQILGRPVVVWRDPRLRGNDYIDEALADRIAKSAVFVGVLSPPFLASDWCQWELDRFVEGRSSDLEGAARVPVFKVLKRPVERSSEPRPLDRVRGYPFYEMSDAEGRAREFLQEPESKVNFYLQADDLAEDIAALVSGMEFGSGSSESGTIYLATASSDMKPYQDDLRRELERHDYAVAPPENATLPSDQLVADIDRRVADADVCVHLVGNRYSLVPEGDQRSLCRLQLDASRRRAGPSGGRRFVWLAPDGSEPNERQVKLRQRLLAGYESDPTSEVVTGSFEDFKSHLFASLSRPAAAPAESGAVARFYVACPPEEIEDAHRLAEWLEQRGVAAAVPMSTGSEAEQREVENDELTACDAVVLLWQYAPEYWVRNRLMMIRKASAAREVPIDSVGVLRLGGPVGSFRTPDATVIDAAAGSFAALDDFVASVHPSRPVP